jgi:hypothetical protein
MKQEKIGFFQIETDEKVLFLAAFAARVPHRITGTE